jgi:hypothetical protein
VEVCFAADADLWVGFFFWVKEKAVLFVGVFTNGMRCPLKRSSRILSAFVVQVFAFCQKACSF